MLGLVNLGGGSVSLTGASMLPKPHDYVPPRCGQEYQAQVPDFDREAAFAATESMGAGAGAAQAQPRWRAAFELGQRSLSVRSSLPYDDLQRGAHFALFQTPRGAPLLAATSTSSARNLSDASGAAATVHGSPSASTLASAAAARALEGLLQEYGATSRRRLLPASRGAHRFEGRGTSAGPGLEVILAAYQGCAGSVEAVRACLDVSMAFAEAPAAPVTAADYERRTAAWLGVLRAAVEFAARQRAASAAGTLGALASTSPASATAAASPASCSSAASGVLTSAGAMEVDGGSPAAAAARTAAGAAGASAAPQLLSLAPPGGRPAVSPSSASMSVGGVAPAALSQPAVSAAGSVPIAGPAAAGAASSSSSSVYRGADPREPVTSQYATAVLQAATAFCFAAAIAEARVKAAGRIGAAAEGAAAASTTASAAAPSPSLSATVTEAPHAAVAVLLLPHVPPPRPLPAQRVARGKESAWADAEVRTMRCTPEMRAMACGWSVAWSVALRRCDGIYPPALDISAAAFRPCLLV